MKNDKMMCLVLIIGFSLGMLGLVRPRSFESSIHGITTICWITGVFGLMWVVITMGLHFKWPGFTTPFPEGARALKYLLLLTGIPGSLIPAAMCAFILLKHYFKTC